MYIINTIPHGKCFVRYLRTRCFCIRNRTSERSERVRFLIRQQLVRKYGTPAVCMKYSLCTFFLDQETSFTLQNELQAIETYGSWKIHKGRLCIRVFLKLHHQTMWMPWSWISRFRIVLISLIFFSKPFYFRLCVWLSNVNETQYCRYYELRWYK